MFTGTHGAALSAVLVVAVAGVAATALHVPTLKAALRHLQRLHLVRAAFYLTLLVAPWGMLLVGVSGFNTTMATTNTPASLSQSMIWAVAGVALIAGVSVARRRAWTTRQVAPPAGNPTTTPTSDADRT